MENLNKITFKNFKINESTLFIPMESIKQQFDINEDIKLYLFKVLYIHKYHSKTDTFTCYLSPIDSLDIPIVKADIPLELLYIHKFIGGYDYKRPLAEDEQLVIKERMYRSITNINMGYAHSYLLCYGYLINRYKNDDANTKITEGIQEFSFTENYRNKLKDGSYESYFLFNFKLRNIVKLMLINTKPSLANKRNKEKLEIGINNILKVIKFKKLPDKFFEDKEKRHGNNRLKK